MFLWGSSATQPAALFVLTASTISRRTGCCAAANADTDGSTRIEATIIPCVALRRRLRLCWTSRGASDPFTMQPCDRPRDGA
eukprot:2737613-Prymnesium_polylepis.1